MTLLKSLINALLALNPSIKSVVIAGNITTLPATARRVTTSIAFQKELIRLKQNIISTAKAHI